MPNELRTHDVREQGGRVLETNRPEHDTASTECRTQRRATGLSAASRLTSGERAKIRELCTCPTLVCVPRCVKDVRSGICGNAGRQAPTLTCLSPTSADDIVVALALGMDPQAQEIGRAVLPATFRSCFRAASVPSHALTSCYLFGGSYFPSGCPSCTACSGHEHVKARYPQEPCPASTRSLRFMTRSSTSTMNSTCK
jgi:hypothetical protein